MDTPKLLAAAEKILSNYGFPFLKLDISVHAQLDRQVSDNAEQRYSLTVIDNPDQLSRFNLLNKTPGESVENLMKIIKSKKPAIIIHASNTEYLLHNLNVQVAEKQNVRVEPMPEFL